MVPLPPLFLFLTATAGDADAVVVNTVDADPLPPRRGSRRRPRDGSGTPDASERARPAAGPATDAVPPDPGKATATPAPAAGDAGPADPHPAPRATHHCANATASPGSGKQGTHCRCKHPNGTTCGRQGCRSDRHCRVRHRCKDDHASDCGVHAAHDQARTATASAAAATATSRAQALATAQPAAGNDAGAAPQQARLPLFDVGHPLKHFLTTIVAVKAHVPDHWPDVLADWFSTSSCVPLHHGVTELGKKDGNRCVHLPIVFRMRSCWHPCMHVEVPPRARTVEWVGSLHK